MLQIIERIAVKGPLAFSEAVAELGLPASSTHSLLQTHALRNYLLLDPEERRYHIGLRLWEVAQTHVTSESLMRLAQPIMDRAVELTGETVQLARLYGLENIYVAISESPQPIKLVSAVGKVQLAGLPESELRRWLSWVTLPRFTTNTIVDREALLLALREIRDRGYATDNEEYVVGCRCVAMPIRDVSGAVVAAMSVMIPDAEVQRGACSEGSPRAVRGAGRAVRTAGPRPAGGRSRGSRRDRRGGGHRGRETAVIDSGARSRGAAGGAGLQVEALLAQVTDTPAFWRTGLRGRAVRSAARTYWLDIRARARGVSGLQHTAYGGDGCAHGGA